jgi:hypothetical protein
MKGLLLAASVACGLLWGACAQETNGNVGSSEGSNCASCHHGNTAGGGSGAGASGTAGGAGSGSSTVGTTGSSGASSGSSSSGAGCSGALVTGTLVASAVGQTLDAGQPVAGAQVSAIAVDGVPIAGEAAVSGPFGAFALCVTPGEEFSTGIQATGYAQAYIEDLDLDGGYSGGLIPLIQTATVQAFAAVLAGFDPSDAVIVTEMVSASGQPPCNVLGGWAVSAHLPDGGAVSYQTAYGTLTGLISDTRTSTDSLGLGYLYNLDPTVTDAVIVTATQVDGGAYCPINDGGPFTGRVVIGAGAFSSAPLVLP